MTNHVVHVGWHSVISPYCLAAATRWHETASPQRLRPPSTRVTGDKEPLDKAQIFLILFVEGYSVIQKL